MHIIQRGATSATRAKAKIARKWMPAVLVIPALFTACGGSATTKALGPVTKYRNSLPGLTASAPIDLIQTIFAFAPKGASVVHKHSSPNLATVLQGQITVKSPAGETQAVAGGALVEPTGQAVQAINTGTGEAMVAVAFPVSHGVKPTAPVVGAPAPLTPNKALYTFTLNSPSITGSYSMVQQVLDFAPGSSTPKHRHGGPGVITVVQGQVTLNSDGTAHVYGTGQSFTEMPGQTLQAFNKGTTDAIVVATYLLPDGAQLTTTV